MTLITPPQIIEFAGAPGSGKTTISARTRELLSKNGFQSAHPTAKSALLANKPLDIKDIFWHLYLLRHLNTSMVRLLTLRRSTRDPERTRFVRRLKDVVKACLIREHLRELNTNSGAGLIVRCDGNLGRIALFFARGIVSRHRALSILHGLYPPRTLFVIVDTPAQETIRRQIERGSALSLNPAVPLSEQSDSIDAFYAALRDLAQELKTTHDCDVVVLDGTAPIELNAHRIAELV